MNHKHVAIRQQPGRSGIYWGRFWLYLLGSLAASVMLGRAVSDSEQPCVGVSSDVPVATPPEAPTLKDQANERVEDIQKYFDDQTEPLPWDFAVLYQAVFTALTVQDQGGTPIAYSNDFEQGRLSDAEIFVNYFGVAKETDRGAILPYVQFCRKFRSEFIPAGLYSASGGQSSDFNEDFAQFSSVAAFYTPEVEDLLAANGPAFIDDISTAYAVTTHPDLKKLYDYRTQLEHRLLSRVGKKVLRKYDDDNVAFIFALRRFRSIELMKLYLLQDALINDRALRDVIWATMILDLSPQFFDSELGGGLQLHPDTLSVTMTLSLPQQTGNVDRDQVFVVQDMQAHMHWATFTRYHLHAMVLDSHQYARPSGSYYRDGVGQVGDVLASHGLHSSSDLVMTPLGEDQFCLVYLRALPDDDLTALIFNLGMFNLDGTMPRDSK